MTRFSQVYCKSSEVYRDSERFRVRLSNYLWNELDARKLTNIISKTLGINIPVYYRENSNNYYYVKEYIEEQARLPDVLDIITLAYNLLASEENYSSWNTLIKGTSWFDGKANQKKFFKFVNTCFSEENLCYRVDESGTVHYYPDEEFYQSQRSTLKCLDSSRYKAVTKEFNQAYEMLDSNPPKTKMAIKSIFESLEILCKLLTWRDKNTSLGARFIENELKPLLGKYYSNNDDTAKFVVSSLTESFAQWVTGMHKYRHGQHTTEPNDPPLEIAVVAISTGAAFLRWLTEIDAKKITSISK